MSLLLNGRYGYYSPRNPEERARARKQAEKRRAEATRIAAWMERTRWCTNGCGKEAARYSGDGSCSLRHSGACSPECEAAVEQREQHNVGVQPRRQASAGTQG